MGKKEKFFFILITLLISLPILVACLFFMPKAPKIYLNNQETLIHTNFWDDNGNPVCTGLNSQSNLQVVATKDHFAAFCYLDLEYHGGIIPYYVYRIVVQKINSLGDTLWGTNGIIINNGSLELYPPQIVSDDAGGIIVTWAEERNSNVNIYAQRIDANGNINWTQNGVVICNADDLQKNPKIVSDGDGGAIIVWEDYRNSQSTDCDIYAQKINSSGQIQWQNNGIPICTETGNQINLRICSDENGGAIIAWEDCRNYATSEIDIFAQRISSDGQAKWTNNGTPICTADNDQKNLDICPDDSKGAIIVWEDYRNTVSDDCDLYAARINSYGITPWAVDGEGIWVSNGRYAKPLICSDDNGGAFVAYIAERNSGTKNDIYVLHLNSTGGRKWATFVCNANEDQESISIAKDYKSVFVAWQDNRDGNWDIYVNYINTSGIPKWTNGLTRCNQAGNQTSPKICRTAIGSAIIGWIDERTGDSHIYANSVSKYSESGEIPGFEISFVIIGFVSTSIIFVLRYMKSKRIPHSKIKSI
ncbi:MAG: hypothetical protein ACTSRP_21465 [Candidatus Helarchaeota archaeon]